MSKNRIIDSSIVPPLQGTRVRLLIHDQHIRIMHTTTGQLLRELILDPERDYQPQKQKDPHPER